MILSHYFTLPPFQGPTFPIIGAGVHKKGLSKPNRRAALAQGMAVCLFVEANAHNSPQSVWRKKNPTATSHDESLFLPA